MASVDKLRTFLAVYRAGSVTGGARQRLISQPAASQQLASLERSIGSPLFRRTAGGIEPTARGRELYAEVAGPIDQLEQVLAGLDGGRLTESISPVRIGSTQEYVAARVLPLLSDDDVAVSVQFGDGAALSQLLVEGDLDIVLSPTTPTRRHLITTPIGSEGFSLVVATSLAPTTPLRSFEEVRAWLTGRPWVAYSPELPITRRFWTRSLGTPFAAALRLTAPDLRIVADAVRRGMGASLLPTYVVDDLLAEGSVTELIAVSDEVASQQWFASTLAAERVRPDVTRVLSLLSDR